MPTNLNDIFHGDQPLGLVEPFELFDVEEIVGVHFAPLALMGIFNPMGPTLVTLNLMIKDDAEKGAVIYHSFNPFSFTQLVTACSPISREGAFGMLKDLHRVGDDYLLGGFPTVVVELADIEDYVAGLKDLLRNLVTSIPSTESLAKTSADFRDHWRDPWTRIPSMEDMMEKVVSGQVSEPERMLPSDEEFDEWYSIVTNPEHVPAELGAIVQGWEGSIRMSGGLPHTPLEKVVEELESLGFEYLSGVV